KTRAQAKSIVWGRVRNAAGEERTHKVETPEGYTLTAMAALHIARRVAAGDFKTGFQTPAGCYGAGLLTEITG
ncbi:MAG: saccharopine dehydrogenase, partial [Bacteroidota bacterium]